MGNCKYCKSAVQESFYFCPNCGRKLKEPPFKFSIGKTIVILLGSFLLPPIGLIPGIRYFLKNDIRAQIIGILAIALTIISMGIFIVTTANLINRTMNTYNSIMELQGGGANLENQAEILNQLEDLQGI